MGPGLWFYTQSGCLNNQPSQWGIILNFPIGRGSEVHQIWFEQSSGKVMHRGGNGSGWNGTWKYFSPGTATAAQVLSGYTFSSADGSNLSGSMVNRGALNWSGSNTTYTVPAGYYSGGTLNSKTSYTNGYNAGVTAGTNSGTPNMISGAHWVIDSCDNSSWTCSTAGMYLVYVYGYVKVSSRYVTPTVTFSGGTKKAEGTISSATADVRKGWIYQFSSGNKVSCSWKEYHGTYSWRNGFLIIRIK